MAETREKTFGFDFQFALDQLNQEVNWTLSDDELTDIFQARAKALARRADREHSTGGALHIRFIVSGVTFAVDLKHVRTIAVPHWVTMVPGVPGHLCRVFQVGGRIVSLLELGALLGLRGAVTDAKQAVLLEHQGSLLGVIVQRVLGIGPLDTRELSPSTASTSRGTEFVTGITADMTLVLDAPRLLRGLRFESTQTG